MALQRWVESRNYPNDKFISYTSWFNIFVYVYFPLHFRTPVFQHRASLVYMISNNSICITCCTFYMLYSELLKTWLKQMQFFVLVKCVYWRPFECHLHLSDTDDQMSWQQFVHWLPWVYYQMEPNIYHHISPFSGHVKVGLATGQDLLMKSTWTSLFSADISITLPAYHFLPYSPRMYWPGFGNTMSGLDSTNPEHMSVFMSCDVLSINSIPPPLGTNTWYDVVPDMDFTPWKT